MSFDNELTGFPEFVNCKPDMIFYQVTTFLLSGQKLDADRTHENIPLRRIRMNELTVKRKTLNPLIRYYHANLFLLFYSFASSEWEEGRGRVFWDYVLERRYSGFWEYLIETFVEFEHPCCSERLLQRFCCNIHYFGFLSFILLASCWKELGWDLDRST